MTTHGNNNQLKSLVERIENVNSEIKDLQADRKQIMDEAKGLGFDPKIIRILIRERQMDESERAERDMLIETYAAALGMLVDTPLGKAAMDTKKGKDA